MNVGFLFLLIARQTTFGTIEIIYNFFGCVTVFLEWSCTSPYSMFTAAIMSGPVTVAMHRSEPGGYILRPCTSCL